MTITSLYRWLGSENPENHAGHATFKAGHQSVTVSLASFEDARAIANLIDHATKTSRDTALASFSGFVRGALNQLENRT